MNLEEIEKELAELERQQAKLKKRMGKTFATPEMSLLEYFVEGWKEAGTSGDLKLEFYVEAIAEHLEALYRREIRNLIVNIAPRHAKSTFISVLFPTWVWTHTPTEQFLTAAYGARLSTRDAVASRRLINSNWYQSRWKHVFKLREDVNQKTLYENNHNGRRYATSVTGGAIGEGSDILLIDDPHKPGEIRSSIMRQNVIDWYTDTLSSRWNNEETFAKVIIMQRLHQSDLCGYLLENEKDKWCQLRLPIEYEGDNSKNIWGWSDPRKYVGELLSPDILSEDGVAEQKLKGRIRWANQYQQRPVPESGGYVLKTDILRYTKQGEYLKFDKVVASFDLAKKIKKDSKYTVGTIWGVKGLTKYLIGMRREKVLFSEQIDLIMDVARTTNNLQYILIESEIHGNAVIETIKKELAKTNLNIQIIDIEVKGLNSDKETRFLKSIREIENHSVYVPYSDSCPWVDIWIDEITTFPLSEFTDICDSTSQFLNWLDHKNITQTYRDVDKCKELLRPKFNLNDKSSLDVPRYWFKSEEIDSMKLF
jgi:predicted phage terminase large subunit-like protein